MRFCATSFDWIKFALVRLRASVPYSLAFRGADAAMGEII